MPRPPILQPRPQIQGKPFQPLGVPRQRGRGGKRNVARLSSSQEMSPPKHKRRMDPPLQGINRERERLKNNKRLVKGFV